MATECVDIVCTTTCTAPLPETEWSLCNPQVNYGEIDAFLVTNIGNPLTDETSAIEWAGRKALLLTDPMRIDEWHVTAEKPAPETTEITISRNVTVTGSKTHTITGEIQQTSNKNYNSIVRQYECAKKVLFWYRTAGGKLYGGASGIEGSLITNLVIPKSRKELSIIQFSVKWEAKFSPCVCDSPF